MNKFQNDKISEMAQILLYRLEKISTDSSWAHQASGVRASIAKIISRKDLSPAGSTREDLEILIRLGFEILENAAGEIPEDQQ